MAGDYVVPWAWWRERRNRAEQAKRDSEQACRDAEAAAKRAEQVAKDIREIAAEFDRALIRRPYRREPTE